MKNFFIFLISLTILTILIGIYFYFDHEAYQVFCEYAQIISDTCKTLCERIAAENSL